MEGGDAIALEAKYHLQRLTALRNHHRLLVQHNQQEFGYVIEKKVKARALVELLAYTLKTVWRVEPIALNFQLYGKRLSDLGVEKEINGVLSRFSEKILAYFPYAKGQSDGKNKITFFEQDIQEMLKQLRRLLEVTTRNDEADMVLLAKAAKIVRKDIASYVQRVCF